MFHSKEEVLKLLKNRSCKACSHHDLKAYLNYDQNLGWCNLHNDQSTTDGFWCMDYDKIY